MAGYKLMQTGFRPLPTRSRLRGGHRSVAGIRAVHLSLLPAREKKLNSAGSCHASGETPFRLEESLEGFFFVFKQARICGGLESDGYTSFCFRGEHSKVVEHPFKVGQLDGASMD